MTQIQNIISKKRPNNNNTGWKFFKKTSKRTCWSKLDFFFKFEINLIQKNSSIDST